MTQKKTPAKKAAPAKKATPKKTSAAKPKKAAAKPSQGSTQAAKKPGRPKKQPVKAQPSYKGGAKDGDGDGKVQDGTKFERIATSQTSTNSVPSNVVVSASGFAPVAVPSNVSHSSATGSVPPANIQKQIADSAKKATAKPAPKKKGPFRRFFGIFKRNK